MVDRLKKMSGYNMLKPEYTHISNPLKIELNHLSPSEENMVIDMFRLAYNTITLVKNLECFKNIVTEKIIKNNLELILFMSPSNVIPYWSVALEVDNKGRSKAKVLYIMMLDKADVTEDVVNSIKKHFTDIIMSSFPKTNPPVLVTNPIIPITNPHAPNTNSPVPKTDPPVLVNNPIIPITNPHAPNTNSPVPKTDPSVLVTNPRTPKINPSYLKTNPSAHINNPLEYIPHPLVPKAEQSAPITHPLAPPTNPPILPPDPKDSSKHLNKSIFGKEITKATIIIIVVGILTLVLIGIIGFV
ncbi:hypothetical protein HZS_3328, partial [Henneguya salminicola]